MDIGLQITLVSHFDIIILGINMVGSIQTSSVKIFQPIVSILGRLFIIIAGLHVFSSIFLSLIYIILIEVLLEALRGPRQLF